MKKIFFLDDERKISDVSWVAYMKYDVVTFRTTKSLINYIKTYCGNMDWSNVIFSLDHDLQEFDKDGNERTGYTFVKWLVDYFIEKGISLDALDVVVHSKNPIGKENIESYIFNARLHSF